MISYMISLSYEPNFFSPLAAMEGHLFFDHSTCTSPNKNPEKWAERLPEIIRDGSIRYDNRVRRMTKQRADATTSEGNSPSKEEEHRDAGMPKDGATTSEWNRPSEEERRDAGMPKDEYRFLVVDRSGFLTPTKKKKGRRSGGEEKLPANIRVVPEEEIFDEIAKIDTTDNVKNTSDDVKTTSDDVKTTSDNVKTPTDNVKTPTDNVKTPTDNVKTTTDNVKTTTDNAKTTTDNVKTVVVLLRNYKGGSAIGNRLFTSLAQPLHLAQVKIWGRVYKGSRNLSKDKRAEVN